jgi:CheY-like chemotaxis protein
VATTTVGERTLLVVDDSRDWRDLVGILLELNGYNVVAVENGLEAFRALDQGLEPAMILLDRQMPGFDAIWFLAQRRQNARMARIPVVLLSNDGDVAETAAAFDIPGMPKPLDINQLLGLIRSTIGPPPASRSMTQSALATHEDRRPR